MKKIGSILTVLTCLFVYSLSQGQVSFVAKAPQSVGVNEGFTVSYIVNTSNPSHFQPPRISGAEIVAGPSTMHSSSTRSINGKISSSSSVTFSYTLVASKQGTVNIGPAKIQVNNQTYSSNTLTIQVVNNPTMAQRGYNWQRGGRYGQQTQKNMAQDNQEVQIDNKAVFVRALPSKTDVVKGEEVIITYKLYTLLPVSEYQIDKIPSTTGFWIEELDRQSNPKLSVEVYNGQRYQVADLRKVIVFPQRSGTLSIKPMSLSIVAHVVSHKRQNFSTGDPFFDQFFNDPLFSSFGTSYKSVKKKIYTNAITFNVKDLPNKLDNYCGGVGKFSISGDISSKRLKAFEPFYLTYTLSGKGNLTLINNLPLNLPDEFQLSDPEITDNIQRDASGVYGMRTFRYLVIPRVEGKFVFPGLNISYYDIDKRMFDTLILEDYQVQVAKGEVNSDFLDQLDARLKYRNMKIKSDVNVSSLDRVYHIFDMTILYCIPFVLILLLCVSILIFSRYKRVCADVVNVKMKRSTKIAIKRLKKAKKFLDKSEMESFEDETAIALWTYVEDRFKMDRQKLSLQGCKDELISLGMIEETVNKLVNILNRCQYLRFSQDKEAIADITLYNDTIDVISSIEEQMKKLKKVKKTVSIKKEHEINIPKYLSIIMFCFLLFGFMDLSYAQSKYDVSLSAKQFCIKADSCFKQSDYANAMLYYEKALKLSPSNEDIQLNINITRSRLVGDTYVMPDFILLRWVKYISGLIPLPVWAVLFISLFILTCVMFFVYFFSLNKKVLFFYICLGCLVLSLSSMLLGIVRQNIVNDNTNAIIMKSNTHLRETKNITAKDIVIMYKGQKVKILENSGDTWIKVQTEDNKVGYMENKNFRRI